MVVMTVIGTRPQFIKCALVSKEIRSRGITEILVNTGQHYDDNMSDIFIRELEIPHINYKLDVGSDTHAKQTARMMIAIEDVIGIEHPDIGIVYGDTNSTLSAALVFAKLHIPFMHIEAGLRSYDMSMPEEQNRIVVDALATIKCAPTKRAIKNLRDARLSKNTFLTGDVMFDVLKKHEENISRKEEESYILATIHRAENTDDTYNIIKILSAFAYSHKKIVFPMHPRTRKVIKDNDIAVPHNVTIINPVSYFEMLALELNAERIITDSGGVQKEAFIFGVPCATIRTSTEWVETIRSGANKLIPLDVTSIINAINDKRSRIKAKKEYGSGNACSKIVDILEYVKWN